MYYDNYDFEEAYQKQIDTLEEWELEKLLKEGKVESLYRTTTTKSKNIESGKELLESQIYPSFHHRSDVPRTRKKRPCKPSQRNLNDKNARRYLIRLANINFGKGDLWCTFGWDDEYLPTNIDDAKRDITNFIKRVRRYLNKLGIDFKYIYVLAFDGYVRPHFHLLMNGKGVDRDTIENLWGKCARPNTRRISRMISLF